MQFNDSRIGKDIQNKLDCFKSVSININHKLTCEMSSGAWGGQSRRYWKWFSFQNKRHPSPLPDNVERNAQRWNNQHEDPLYHILDSDHLGPGSSPGPGPGPLPAPQSGPTTGGFTSATAMINLSAMQLAITRRQHSVPPPAQPYLDELGWIYVSLSGTVLNKFKFTGNKIPSFQLTPMANSFSHQI